MTQKFFIQHGERLLIDRDYGALGLEAITVDGPMSLETARETVEAYDLKGGEISAVYRINLAELNIENVTEDLIITPDPFEDMDHDSSIGCHERSMSDAVRFI